MDTLDRYLAREFLTFFLVAWAGLSVLFLAVDFFARYWDFNFTIGKIAALYLYQVPAMLQQFLPVAALIATLLLLSTMSRQNEILALYLGGIGLWRLVSTFVAIVATLSTISFMFFDSWVPYFEKKRTLIRQGLAPSDEHLLLFGHQRFWYRSGRIIYNVGRYIPEKNILENLNIYILDERHRVRERLQAKVARYVNEEWLLEDGLSVQFPESHFPVSKSFKRLAGIIPEKPTDFRTLKLDESMMRLKELRRYIERNKAYGFDTTHQEVSYHERMALVVAPLVFVLFAVALSAKALKYHSSIRSVGLSFGIVFVYILLFRVFLSLGRGGYIPPVLAGWTVNGLFFGAAAAVMARAR